MSIYDLSTTLLFVSLGIIPIYFIIIGIIYYQTFSKNKEKYALYPIQLDENKSSVFETFDDVNDVIDRYIITKQNNQYLLMFKYHEEIKESHLMIQLYNKKKRIFQKIYLDEIIQKSHTPIIKLPEKTKYFDIKKEENNFSNKKLKYNVYFIYESILRALIFSMLFFPLALFVVSIYDSTKVNSFFNWMNMIILEVGIGVITLIHIILNIKTYLNKKKRG